MSIAALLIEKIKQSTQINKHNNRLVNTQSINNSTKSGYIGTVPQTAPWTDDELELNGTVIPKFIIIGAMKCGTSAIATFLNEHSKLYDMGETYFFNRNHDQG